MAIVALQTITCARRNVVSQYSDSHITSVKRTITVRIETSSHMAKYMVPSDSKSLETNAYRTVEVVVFHDVARPLSIQPGRSFCLLPPFILQRYSNWSVDGQHDHASPQSDISAQRYFQALFDSASLRSPSLALATMEAHLFPSLCVAG